MNFVILGLGKEGYTSFCYSVAPFFELADLIITSRSICLLYRKFNILTMHVHG